MVIDEPITGPTADLIRVARETGRAWHDAERLLARVRAEPATTSAVRAWARPEVPAALVARVHYVLSALGALEDESAFFADWGRPMPAACPVDVVDLPGGTFQMGPPEGLGHAGASESQPVTLRAFAMGRTVVTRRQFAAFDPDFAGDTRPDHPMVDVDWYTARLYCRWAGGDLPTEAQWEYACRAGSEGGWCCGDDRELTAYAWFLVNTRRQTHPVARLLPNAFGLYDVHGNVREWTGAWYRDHPSPPRVEALGPTRGAGRVYRGGSIWFDAATCRSAARAWWPPWDRADDLGLRLARPA